MDAGARCGGAFGCSGAARHWLEWRWRGGLKGGGSVSWWRWSFDDGMGNEWRPRHGEALRRRCKRVARRWLVAARGGRAESGGWARRREGSAAWEKWRKRMREDGRKADRARERWNRRRRGARVGGGGGSCRFHGESGEEEVGIESTRGTGGAEAQASGGTGAWRFSRMEVGGEADEWALRSYLSAGVRERRLRRT